MNVTPELLPKHPIDALRAAESDQPAGIHHGEVLAYRCRECGAADEDVMEIIHEDDCGLAGETAPTAYADRLHDRGHVAGTAMLADGGRG